MMLVSRIFINTFCFFLSLQVICQDFNQFDTYKTLTAKGLMPDDFKVLSYEKVKQDIRSSRTQLKGKKERLFLEGIHYSIDEMLHSGLVVYGDEVSEYISSVSKNLLKDKPDLQKELRFYTLKTSISNAFSTDQGIIFVTTGLISQLTSEAQLAYILAHEISHYTQKHVIESFEHSHKRGNLNKSIEFFSTYSKEKELEADRLAVEMYHAAGYSASEILPTFDVLMYSYLPFDEVVFPKNYFNNDLLFIPEKYFASTSYPIKAKEDTDDSKTSHPAIKKRKIASDESIKRFSNWGNTSSLLGEKLFTYIQTICRFEDVRSDMLNSNYANALYSVFILEKEFPNSIYLQRMKAKIWLNLSLYKEEGKLNKTVPNTSEYEGEIAGVYYFLKAIDKQAFSTVALRQIADIYKKNPTDKEIIAIWERMLKHLVSIEKFDIQTYSKKNFADAFIAFKTYKKDSIQPAQTESDEKLSKYDKIKKKKNANEPESFDSTKFYLYALSDLVNDERFLLKFSELTDEYKTQKLAIDTRKKLRGKELRLALKQEEQNKLRLGISKMILVEPMIFSYKKENLNQVKSEKTEKVYIEETKSIAEELNMDINVIGSSTLMEHGTSGFNERGILLNYMSQLMEEKNIDPFPVDFALLDEIKTNYETNKVMFSVVSQQYNADIHPRTLLILLAPPLIPPYVMIFLPIKFMTGFNTNHSVFILDIEKGKIIDSQHMNYNEPMTRITLKAHLFDILSRIHSNPIKR